MALVPLGAGTPTGGMSLSRSPSPVPGGGWSSPGLNIHDSGRSSPANGLSSSSGTPVMWESTRLKTMASTGYPSFSTHNQGFFSRHMRRLSSNLPRFSHNAPYAEKEKLGRGRWSPNVPLLGRIRSLGARMGRKTKFRLAGVLFLIALIIIFYNTREFSETPFGTLLDPLHSKLTPLASSVGAYLAPDCMVRRRTEVCHYIGSQRGWRRDGVEGGERMGNRTGLCAKQEEVRQELGI
jgi:hypothetical protein